MRKDKARDVGRGVLPSTARKGARENKRNFHSKRRSNQRQACDAILRSLTDVDDDGTLFTDPDLFDDFEEPIIHDGYHASTKGKASSYDDDMAYIVSRRRDADNLGPLFSWARATEAKKMQGWSAEDKRNYFKAVLPDNLQGRHALGHVEQILDLDSNPFEYGWWRRRDRPSPVTKDNFRAALARCLATTKARAALREAVHEAVPVAAHAFYSNLKDKKREQARDENGDFRFYNEEVHEWDPLSQRHYTVTAERPIMVEVWVPRTVTGTCDDCSFLRNDPLATTEAINRFVDIVWAARTWNTWGHNGDLGHPFIREVYDYVIAA